MQTTLNGGETCSDCMPGMRGYACSVDVDECASAPCEYGRCIESGTIAADGVPIARGIFKCECFSGWIGSRCNVCTDDVRWKWRGQSCATLELRYKNTFCPKNRFHIRDKCPKLCSVCKPTPACSKLVLGTQYDASHCAHEHGGFNCSVRCAMGYVGHTSIVSCKSQATTNTSTHEHNWMGVKSMHRCADVDECISNPCVHGLCSESSTDVSVSPSAFKCKCSIGYAGTRCEAKVKSTENPCQSKPCFARWRMHKPHFVQCEQLCAALRLHRFLRWAHL